MKKSLFVKRLKQVYGKNTMSHSLSKISWSAFLDFYDPISKWVYRFIGCSCGTCKKTNHDNYIYSDIFNPSILKSPCKGLRSNKPYFKYLRIYRCRPEMTINDVLFDMSIHNNSDKDLYRSLYVPGYYLSYFEDHIENTNPSLK